jgi:glucosamine-6-phosphate deaminase
MAVLKDYFAGTLRVRVFDTRAAMGDCAGRDAARRLKTLLENKDEISVMFAAAPSQNETLAALRSDPDIDWSRINAFHMDEYAGLPPSHPAGFRNYLRRMLFDLLPFRSVHLIDGNARNPQEEAARYAALLSENPLDICLLGVGENGHVAFNDPPVADFHDPLLAKVVELDQACREQQVHDGCFARLEEVPTHAITVTVPGLTGAGALFCSVPSSTKAAAVQCMLGGQVTTGCPASILTRHPDAALYLDADSGRHIL